MNRAIEIAKNPLLIALVLIAALLFLGNTLSPGFASGGQILRPADAGGLVVDPVVADVEVEIARQPRLLEAHDLGPAGGSATPRPASTCRS